MKNLIAKNVKKPIFQFNNYTIYMQLNKFKQRYRFKSLKKQQNNKKIRIINKIETFKFYNNY